MSQPHTLLICTVGGSIEPIAASLKHWRPSRVLFVPSSQTKPDIEGKILPLARQEGVDLGPGCYDYVVVPDAQDFTACLHKMRDLAPQVAGWLARGADYTVVVDYTGGTKTMSAALALQAHPWGCQFAYVGGTERTKNDVGVVVSGKEQMLHMRNPWEALGYDAIADAVVLFNQAAYAAAGQLLQRALQRVQDPGRKRELSALKILADAYDAWDRFQHRDASNRLGDVRKGENDLRPLLGNDATEQLFGHVDDHRRYLAELLAQEGATRPRVLDLLANAARRRAEGRYDDAVARLYRAIEALAQLRLREAHSIPDTAAVPLNQIPEALRTSWSVRAVNGTLSLGLQDDYSLLQHLGNDLGQRFHACGLDDRQTSPLNERNHSILAHGFNPISDKRFGQLWKAALALAQITEAALPNFPRLRASG